VTEHEREKLRFFEECAQRYGWTDEPDLGDVRTGVASGPDERRK